MRQPHIQLDETLNVKYALLPGDPARLDRIAPHLTDVEELGFNREYRSLKGFYKGIGILAMSTGMGGCSTGIAIEELKNIGVDTLIRIGSCGAMQPDIRLGDLIFAAGAVRDDGASQAYVDTRYPAVADTSLLIACTQSAKNEKFPYHVGIVHSHESFYIDDNAKQQRFWAEKGVLGADMETAALLTIARLRGLRAASILNNVVTCGTDTAASIGNYTDGANPTAIGERNEILTALNAFTLMEKAR